MKARLAGIPLPAWILISVLAAASLLQSASGKGTNDNVELQIKAAYLLNFARYVYWPHTSGAESSIPITFGVLGQDPIAQTLEKVGSGKTINGRPVRVRLFPSVEQIDKCDILFVPRSESQHAQSTLTGIAGKPTLTVSDKPGFTNEGGMIEFLLVDDTVRFAISNEAAERVGLKLNSELLRVAYSINGRRQ